MYLVNFDSLQVIYDAKLPMYQLLKTITCFIRRRKIPVTLVAVRNDKNRGEAAELRTDTTAFKPSSA